MGRWLLRLLVLAALAGGILLLRATVFAPKPVAVTVARAERGRVEATATNSKAGTLQARRRARLSPETAGRIAAIPRREGEAVKEGEVLLRLNDESQQAQVELARRSLAATEALHQQACIAEERAKSELERNRRLVKGDIVSQDRIESLESAHRLALASCAAGAAEVEKARAAVGVAEAELRKTEIRAPFGGTIAEVSAEVGEWVTPAPPMLPVPGAVDLLDPTSLYVSAPMDEVDAGLLRVGQGARIAVDPVPGRSFPGRVVRVAPYVLDVEAQNRTVEVEVEFQEPPGALPPGCSADVEVVLEARESVLRIPAQALLEGRKVLVLEGARLAEREVRVGLKNWDFAEIVEGLAEGDRVVASLDRSEIRAGARAVAGNGATP